MAAIAEFLWHCRFEKNLDEKTIRAYRTDLLQFAGEGAEIDDLFRITKADIKSYLQRISGFEYKTIRRKLASLRAMLNFFECEYESYVNPMRKMQIRLKEPKRLPVVMTIDEVRALFGRLYAPSGRKIPDEVSVRNIAVIELLFASGMRVGELCNLRNGDVDLDTGAVRIRGKGNKERMIHLCQHGTLSALRDWTGIRSGVSDPSAPFFTNRLHRGISSQSVRRIVGRVAGDADIRKHVTPHTFRHTFATLLLEEDVDIKYIQNLLGHSSIATTQIYTHVNLHKQRQILRDKHPRRLF